MLITTYVLNLINVKVRKFVLSSKRILAEYHFRIVPPQSVPLVVETFGFWSPFALQTLRTIAERTTARSGASTKQARKHLLQQLSVSLWTNNARMILRYWALQCEDSDFPFPNPPL